MEELIRNRSDLGPEAPSGRDKQSVHTKFKLGEEALNAKERLAEYWGVTQKEVAEMATQLTVSFLEDEGEAMRRTFAEKAADRSGEVVRKTHVVSRETKSFLEEAASEFDLTRDQFFDGALRLAYSMVKFLHEVQLDRHEEQRPRLRELLEEVESIEAELQTEAGKADPLKPALGSIREYLEAILEDLEEELDSGDPLPRNHEFA